MDMACPLIAPGTLCAMTDHARTRRAGVVLRSDGKGTVLQLSEPAILFCGDVRVVRTIAARPVALLSDGRK